MSGTLPKDVARSIAGSTAAVDYPWLPDYLERSLIARAGRAEGASERSRERSEAIRKQIRAAVGVLPLTFELGTLTRIVDGRMGPRGPSQRLIRDEIGRMQKELCRFGTEATTASVYASTIQST